MIPAPPLPNHPTPTPTDVDPHARALIEMAASEWERAIYTPRLLEDASRALVDVYQALAPYGVSAAVLDRGRYDRDPFAHRTLEAVVSAQKTISRTVPMGYDHQLELLTMVASSMENVLGQLVELVEKPTIIGPDPTDPHPKVRAIGRAYLVAPLLPDTDHLPAPLVVSLQRADGIKNAPWAWDLFPDVKGGCGQYASVIAHSPCPRVATEVGAIVAQVLRGERTLRR